MFLQRHVKSSRETTGSKSIKLKSLKRETLPCKWKVPRCELQTHCSQPSWEGGAHCLLETETSRKGDWRLKAFPHGANRSSHTDLLREFLNLYLIFLIMKCVSNK